MGKILTERFTKASIVRTLSPNGKAYNKAKLLGGSLANMKKAFKLKKDIDLVEKMLLDVQKILKNMKELKDRAKLD